MKKLLFVIQLIAFAAVRSPAQEMAFFSALTGAVQVKGPGALQSATLETILSRGMEIITGKTASAWVMYYTGKEVRIPAGSRYRVDAPIDSVKLPHLGGTIQSLLWGGTLTRSWRKNESEPGGATRAGLRCFYPVDTKMRGEKPTFQWSDTRPRTERKYILTLKSEISDFKLEVPVSGTTEFQITGTPLSVEELYVWTVRDASGPVVSAPAHFALLYPDAADSLAGDLHRIDSFCAQDTSSAQRYLLTAALYWQYDLMKETEKALIDLSRQRPKMLHAHRMLAKLYRKVGRAEEANREEQFGAKKPESEEQR